jgi:hypothetical protein
MMTSKKLKFEDLVPNNTVGIAKVTPTVTNMPSYTSLLKADATPTATPYTDLPGNVTPINNVELPVEPQQSHNIWQDMANAFIKKMEKEKENASIDTEPKMTYQQWYENSKANAESTRQSAINDARVEYNRSKSEYGNKAEALRNMGLTGAGYSDYLNGQAYAQMQGAIANANAQKASTIADIDAKYMDYVEQKNQQRYALLDSLDSGNYTVNQLNRYVEQGLLTETELGEYKQKLENKAKNLTSADLNSYTREQLNSLIDSLGIAGYNDAKKHVQKLYDNKYNIKWNTGGGGAFVDNPNGTNTYEVGDKITIKADSIKGDGTMETREFKVKIKAEVTDPSIIEAATQATNGQVFKFGDQLYLKINDTVYSLNKKEYDQLNKLFK